MQKESKGEAFIIMEINLQEIKLKGHRCDANDGEDSAAQPFPLLTQSRAFLVRNHDSPWQTLLARLARDRSVPPSPTRAATLFRNTCFLSWPRIQRGRIDHALLRYSSDSFELNAGMAAVMS